MIGDYQALKDELSKPQYSGLSHSEASDALGSASVITYARKVPVAEIQQAAYDRGVLFAIEAAAAAGSNPAAVGTAWLWSKSRPDYPAVDLQSAPFQAAIAGLVESALISTDDRDYMLSLADHVTTVAESIPGWGLPASPDDVAHARSLS